MNKPKLTAKQSEAINKIIKDMRKKEEAYIILFDILDKDEITISYQVRYNDTSGVAMNYKAWEVTEDNEPDVRKNVRQFIRDMVDDLMDNMGEDNIRLRRVTVMEDGDIG
jgi:LPS sulfotransferase NodH